MEKYGAYGEKMMYGKKVTGVIRSTFVIGPSGKIEHAWYGVRRRSRGEGAGRSFDGVRNIFNGGLHVTVNP